MEKSQLIRTAFMVLISVAVVACICVVAIAACPTRNGDALLLGTDASASVKQGSALELNDVLDDIYMVSAAQAMGSADAYIGAEYIAIIVLAGLFTVSLSTSIAICTYKIKSKKQRTKQTKEDLSMCGTRNIKIIISGTVEIRVETAVANTSEATSMEDKATAVEEGQEPNSKKEEGSSEQNNIEERGADTVAEMEEATSTAEGIRGEGQDGDLNINEEEPKAGNDTREGETTTSESDGQEGNSDDLNESSEKDKQSQGGQCYGDNKFPIEHFLPKIRQCLSDGIKRQFNEEDPEGSYDLLKNDLIDINTELGKYCEQKA